MGRKTKPFLLEDEGKGEDARATTVKWGHEEHAKRGICIYRRNWEGVHVSETWRERERGANRQT